jgi:integrase
LFKNRRCAENRFATLTQLSTKVDRRRVRRPATLEELQWLIAAAVDGATFLGLAGPDRVILYAVAVCTGIRVSELASVTPASLNLEGDVPTVTVAAAYSKHRQEDVQPIPPVIASRLKNWLAENPPERGKTLWPGPWRNRAAEMLRHDLAAARKQWVKAAKSREEKVRRRGNRDFLRYVDSGKRVFDFHALRSTFATNLAIGGTHPRAAQELMRHSDINLTMGTYTNLPKAAIAAELRRLPAVPDGSTAENLATTCNVSCTPCCDAQEHNEHKERENNGAAGTRTQNQQIMSLLL